MTEKKICTKTSVMLALISYIALIAALVGTTLAYFADSVTSSHNKVIAGKLAGSTNTEIAIQRDVYIGAFTCRKSLPFHKGGCGCNRLSFG